MSAEAWSALANWVMACAAVAAAIAAISGVNAWKKQSIWNADHDLAKRILIALYQYRGTLFAIRHPAMYESEMHDDGATSSQDSPNENRGKTIISAYSRRWERHLPSANALDVAVTESAAVWGIELSEKVFELRKLERELYHYMELHFNASYRGDSEMRSEYKKILRTKRDILYDRLNDEDEFRIDFSKHLDPIEKLLRSKMGRGR